jgi:hypothetical protein
MSFLYYLPIGLLIQLTALLHFIRRRPDMYWIYLIIFLGPLGAMLYLVLVALPDFTSAQMTFRGVPRRRRIAELEAAVRENPSAANYEELGDLYMENNNFAQARSAFSNAIAAHADSLDAYYRRALCALKENDPAAAIPDLEYVAAQEPKYDFNRVGGQLALACAQAGQTERAEALFQKAIALCTLSETYLDYANFLVSQGRPAEARPWIQKVIDKQLTSPHYLRRTEQPWIRRASAMLKQLPA